MIFLHRAIQAAGLVEGAKTFSIARGSDAFYIIFTGPAAREMKEARIRGVLMELLAKFIFTKIEQKFVKIVEKAEAAIAEQNIEEVVRKAGNQKISFVEIQTLEVTNNKFNYPVLTLLCKDGRKREFTFRTLGQADVEKFIEGLKF